MRSMRRMGGLVSLLAMGGCGGELSDDGRAGTAVAELTVVPGGVQCVRITIRGVALSFNVTPGASTTTLDLGVQSGGSVQVSAQAYDVACASVTTSTSASWVSDPVSVTIASGIATSISLTLRPATRATASVDFVQPVVAIAAGGNSSYAVMLDGTMRAWGANSAGQLGDGTNIDRATPVSVMGPSGRVQQIAAGDSHACALTALGVSCWGQNDHGQLGDGTTTSRAWSLSVDTSGIAAPITSIAAGGAHSCAATGSTGRSYCWGSNGSGELGDSSTTDRSRPVLVLNSTEEYYAPVAATSGSCALNRLGVIVCWGLNTSGRFGGTPVDFAFTLPSTFGSRAWGSVALGVSHACMVEAGGGVYCAGANGYGQLGDGTVIQRITPVPVTALHDATAIAVGSAHSCAIRQDRTVWCWGRGGFSSLGGGTSDDTNVPTQVLGLRDATALVAGRHHYCALLADGSVRCWGDNPNGQLGDGSLRNQSVPVRVRF